MTKSTDLVAVLASLDFKVLFGGETANGFARSYTGGQYRKFRKVMRGAGFTMIGRDGSNTIFSNGDQYIVFENGITYYFSDMEAGIAMLTPQTVRDQAAADREKAKIVSKPTRQKMGAPRLVLTYERALNHNTVMTAAAVMGVLMGTPVGFILGRIWK